MKIYHVTSVHSASDVRIYTKEASYLSQHYDVYLIAPAKGQDVPNNLIYFSLPNPRTRIQRLTIQFKILKILKNNSPKLIHLHDPELIFLGLLLKLKGDIVIWDVHEDLPGQVLSKNWIPKTLRPITSKIAGLIEIVAGRFFDRIVVVTDSIAKAFPPEKTVLVQNFPIIGELGSSDQAREVSSIQTFVHAGGLTRIRGIAPLIESFAIANEHMNYAAKLLLIGKFESNAFEEECRSSLGWKYVDYYPWVDRQRLAELLAEADAGIVTFLPVPNHTSSQPNKIFEYMSIGLPLIVSDFPLWRELVADRGSGLMVDPGSPQAIAEAIVWLMDHPSKAQAMGERGRQAVLTEFNWNAEFKKLLAMYRELEKE